MGMKARFVKRDEDDVYIYCFCDTLFDSSRLSTQRLYSVEEYNSHEINGTIYYEDFDGIDVYICPNDCTITEDDYEDLSRSRGGFWICGECEGSYTSGENAAECCS
jgi:hypothetical protein